MLRLKVHDHELPAVLHAALQADSSCSAGPELVVGATKRYGLTAAEAMEQCGRPASAEEVQDTLRQLLPGAVAVHARVRSGVRALPPRTAQGSLPLAGLLPDSPASPQ